MELFYSLFMLHIVASVIAFRANLSIHRDNFSIFSKNPDLDRKVRTQRRARRLKQIIPPLVKRLENMERKRIRIFNRAQKYYFGERLSQIPGDGGAIYGRRSVTRDPNTVINYYKGYFSEKAKKRIPCELNSNYDIYKEDEVENAKQIFQHPRKTFGCFEGKTPIIEEPFYKRMDKFYTDKEFHKATIRKTIKKPVKVEIPEKYKAARGYYGLVVEKIFPHISKEQMDKMREMEIAIKTGQYRNNNLLFSAIDELSQELCVG